MNGRFHFRSLRLAACTVILSACAFAPPAHGADRAAVSDTSVTSASLRLDSGFRKLYELNFTGARLEFVAYEQDQPGDPLGKAAEAASYLYEQLNAKGVFTSAFFLNDEKFLNGVDGTAEANRNDRFINANTQAREMAQRNLSASPRDARALLVLTLTDGMESDYLAIVEKRQLASLHLVRHAEADAVKLLAVDPSAQDAYLALGVTNYVIGCMPAYKKAFLWFDGIHGDRQRGIHQLELTAANGHYLRPFAKILLALAYEREHESERAKPLLEELAREFPTNPLYARELALADHSGSAAP
jgi:hypothetical protein